MNITVLGSGNMGGALVKGWAKAVRNKQADFSITCTAKTQNNLDKINYEKNGFLYILKGGSGTGKSS